MCCECGVVAAAVFHMENQCQIQHVGLHHGVILIRTEQTQQILSRGQILIRTVNIHALVTLIMIISVVTVYG